MANQPTITGSTFAGKAAGFYIVSAVSPSVPPKRLVEIGSNGIVITEGTC